ncbi:MFS transporter [Sphingobacterium psychroaquaticum]|uniref:sugar porter family MFS transporter n=1 Tax=Sphingobacterium psychroaquaticum TaxID=561061 RepID=UPI00106B82C6|nr:sugar porter family MFS transporter [Sphingobacterium psychroaquaticum]QBQ41543.1 MFS transporter [Sphingobacterium psychroaquaticum]
MNTLFKLIIATVSLGGFLFGFDMAVISGTIPLIRDSFQLTPVQEGFFVSSALVGCIIGVLFAGAWSNRFGRKPTLLIAAVLFLISAFGCSYGNNFEVVLLNRWIGGVGVGIASIVVPLYIAEISPYKYRGRMVTLYQLAITIGILCAYLSNALIVNNNLLILGETWRTMFLAGAVPSFLLGMGLFFVPESPRWLMNKGRYDQALACYKRLQIEAEQRELEVQATPQASLFAPMYRTALLLGLLLPLFSQLSGINAIVYFGPSILIESGLSISNSFHAQVFFGLANVVFTCFAIWKVDSWGRRPLYLLGTAGATASLLLSGWFLGQDMTLYSNFLIASILCFMFFFAMSIGPLKFVVASEIFPTAIRTRAMTLSILVMWGADTLVGQLTPLLLNRLGSMYTFWLFALFCAIAFVTVYMLLPETKGKTLEEIEQHWQVKHRRKINQE